MLGIFRGLFETRKAIPIENVITVDEPDNQEESGQNIHERLRKEKSTLFRNDTSQARRTSAINGKTTPVDMTSFLCEYCSVDHLEKLKRIEAKLATGFFLLKRNPHWLFNLKPCALVDRIGKVLNDSLSCFH